MNTKINNEYLSDNTIDIIIMASYTLFDSYWKYRNSQLAITYVNQEVQYFGKYTHKIKYFSKPLAVVYLWPRGVGNFRILK